MDSTDAPEWALASGLQPGDPLNARIRVSSISISGETIALESSGVTAIIGSNNSGKSTLLRQIKNVLMNGWQHMQYDHVRLLTGLDLSVEGSDTDFLSWANIHADFRLPRTGEPGVGYFDIGGTSLELNSLRDNWNQLSRNHSLGTLASTFLFSVEGSDRFQYASGASARNEGTDPAVHPIHRFQDNRELFLQLSDLSRRVFSQPLTLDESGHNLRIRIGESRVQIPRLNESRREYSSALAQLPPLDSQGDGVRAFFGLFVPLLGGTQSIILVDEPEAFLHPPQAFAAGKALGELAQQSDVQVILATHDKDFLAGVLASESPLHIARLQRSDKATTVKSVRPSALKEIWEERLLRYSNVLSGLFHRLVVVCEGEQDCHFYQAVLEEHIRQAQDPTLRISETDVLFVPTNGKAAMARIARILHGAGVPTVILPDLDALDQTTIIKNMVESLDGNWATYQADFSAVQGGVNRRKRAPRLELIKADLERLLDEALLSDSNAVMTSEVKDQIANILRTHESDWEIIKRTGVGFFNGLPRQAIDRLLGNLASLGVVPVPVGTLESYAPSFSKNRQWLEKALASDAHKTPAAQQLIAAVLDGRWM